MKNPILSNIKNIYIYFSVWTVVIAVHTLSLFYYYHLDFTASLADGFIFNIIFAGLALSFWYTVRTLNIDSKNRSTFIINHFAAACIFLIVWLFVSYILVGLFIDPKSNYFHFFYHSLPWRIVSGILYYLLMILFYYLYIYYSSFKENIIKEASLKTLVKETELSLLKSQINPHFIFNSLNSINSLTYSNPELASEMIVKLSSFLRYALEQNSKQLVSFSEELENSMLYLDIEKTRFGEKLILKQQIEQVCLSLKIPNLILQPLLENAIKYGVHESTQPVTIELKCTKDQEHLHLVISNNFDPETFNRKGKGIGIKNVKERLYLIYGRRDLINISDKENIFKVSLLIPQNISL